MRATLSDALTAQLHSLRFELSAADARQFRHDLRERLERLEHVAGAAGERDRRGRAAVRRLIEPLP